MKLGLKFKHIGIDRFNDPTATRTRCTFIHTSFRTSVFTRCNKGKPKTRSNKRPILSDLKQSGKIEEDADAVIFIHRPEEYAENEDEKESLKGMAIIDIAKNRSGAKYTDKTIMFHHETTYFYQGV